MVHAAALEAHRLPIRGARRLPMQRHQLAEAGERQAGLKRLQAARQNLHTGQQLQHNGFRVLEVWKPLAGADGIVVRSRC